MGFFDFLTEEIAIDLGTANTLIIHNDKVVVDSPSIVARDRITGKIIAVGKEASMMQGKTHENIKTIRPLKDGVIADFDASEQMINLFIKNIPALKKKMFTPALRMVVCIPSGITEVEMRAVKESCERVNGKEVYLIHEPMAAAIGIGIDIMQPKGNMIVDIGGGTTEVAVISLGGIVYSKSVRVAGDKFDEAIVNYIKKKYSLLIGERTAEMIKISIGNAYPFDEEVRTYEVKGRDLIAGAPKTIEVTSDEIREALSDPIAEVIEAIKTSLEKTPPELAADIVDNGIILAGGGSLLANLDILIKEKTGLPVSLAEDPLTCVVRGCGTALENITLLRQVTTLS